MRSSDVFTLPYVVRENGDSMWKLDKAGGFFLVVTGNDS